ncbi:hypothetical protein AAO40_004450 [Salmonella enterica subsp. enterica]|nr:hypothetical protein [Salmonella enterica subsp. enterica serovar Poona]
MVISKAFQFPGEKYLVWGGFRFLAGLNSQITSPVRFFMPQSSKLNFCTIDTMKKSLTSLCVCGFLFCFLSAEAFASIQLSPMSITLNPKNQYSGVLNVYSNSTEIQYVNVVVKKVKNAATPQQTEESTSPADGDGLVVSPQKFILARNGMHIIRLLPLNIPETEGVYRVYVSTVPEPEYDETAGSKKNSASVSVNIIWGALVYVEPKEKHIEINYNKSLDELKNNGNVHVRITQYGFCKSENACQWNTFGHNIFPGMSYHLTGAKNEEGRYLIVKYQENDREITKKIN